jgi:galactokinase
VLWSLGIKTGIDILVDGQVPLGAGLSSSAALECAIATAINELFDLGLTLPELARAAQRAENIYVGMPCGIMDQSVSLMATQGNALLLDTRDLSIEQIPFNIAPLGLELLVIDTQVHHALVDGGYAERRASCEKAVADLGITSLRDISITDFVARKSELDAKTFIRAFHGITEMQRVLDAVALLKAGDFVGFGEIVTAAHISLRDNYTVSCPELNLAVDTALKFGALGSRMIGGGFGGSAIALIKAKDSDLIKSEIKSGFMKARFKSPRFFSALPSAGARIIN